jgi:hypothetical protein
MDKSAKKPFTSTHQWVKGKMYCLICGARIAVVDEETWRKVHLWNNKMHYIECTHCHYHHPYIER